MDSYSARPILDYATPLGRLRDPIISMRAGYAIILPMLHFLVFNYFKIDSDRFGLVLSGEYAWANFAVNLIFYVGPFVLFTVMALHSWWKHKPPLSPVSRYVAMMGIAINAISAVSQAISVYMGWWGYLK